MTERIQIKCPTCRGGKKVGVISADNSRPPELVACWTCNGTGVVTDPVGECAPPSKEG